MEYFLGYQIFRCHSRLRQFHSLQCSWGEPQIPRDWRGKGGGAKSRRQGLYKRRLIYRKDGLDSDQICEIAKRLQLKVKVHPGRDHANPIFHDYKLFLNPSTTDVVCTTTVEALAMGKLVVIANHTSNEFFKQLPNCRMYNTSKGFVKATQKALSEEPGQMTDELRHQLLWESATERFLESTQLNQPPPRNQLTSSSKNFLSTSLSMKKNLDDVSAFIHQTASGSEVSRRVFGAIPGSLQPDEELHKDLGLADPSPKKSSKT